MINFSFKGLKITAPRLFFKSGILHSSVIAQVWGRVCFPGWGESGWSIAGKTLLKPEPTRDRARVWLWKWDCLTLPGPVLRRGFFTNNNPTLPRCLLIPHFFSPVHLCCCSSLLLYRVKKWTTKKKIIINGGIGRNSATCSAFPPAPHYDREKRKGETRGMQAEEEKVLHCFAEQWNWRGK